MQKIVAIIPFLLLLCGTSVDTSKSTVGSHKEPSVIASQDVRPFSVAANPGASSLADAV